MSDISSPEKGKQFFKLDDFEGPLDLLLFLVRKNEVNIYDIPIALITEQFLHYMELATRMDLENITEFYTMAATLLYIKSRMLLPVEIDLEEEMEDPRQELVAKLIEYQKYKKLTALMVDQEAEAEMILERKKKERILPFDDNDDLWEKIEVWDLLKTFMGLMKGMTPERVINLYEEVSVNEKVSLIYELLESREAVNFVDIISHPDSIMDVICSFLAILELVKGRKIIVFQNKFFGDIQIKARIQDQRGDDDES